MEKVNKKVDVRTMVVVSVLGVIASLLMMARFPLPFAPGFMDVDISEMPALLASFSIGPLAGFLVVLVKIVIKVMSGSTTIYVGELSNLIVSSTFVVTAGLVYRFNKTKKGALKALLCGVLAMSILATLSNYFIIFPMYGKLMGLSMQDFAGQVSSINPLVKNFGTLMVFSIFPFNLVKGTLTSLVTYLVYKRVAPIIKG